jgi:hypothetical protein
MSSGYRFCVETPFPFCFTHQPIKKRFLHGLGQRPILISDYGWVRLERSDTDSNYYLLAPRGYVASVHYFGSWLIAALTLQFGLRYNCFCSFGGPLEELPR